MSRSSGTFRARFSTRSQQVTETLAWVVSLLVWVHLAVVGISVLLGLAVAALAYWVAGRIVDAIEKRSKTK